MPQFTLTTPAGTVIRFETYPEAARTAQAFLQALPHRVLWRHAMTSGQEIWTPEAPPLDVIQENSSVFVRPGEVVIGPIQPKRNQIAGCMGIYYGEGKGLDSGNVFAAVLDEDYAALIALGHEILLGGEQLLQLDAVDQ